jgi:hypothetical protein
LERCKQTVTNSSWSPSLFPPHTVQYEATHARFRLMRRRKGMPNAALSFPDLSGKFPEGFRYFSGPVGFRKVSGSFQVIFWLNSQNRTGNIPETYRKTCFFTGRILLVSPKSEFWDRFIRGRDPEHGSYQKKFESKMMIRTHPKFAP